MQENNSPRIDITIQLTKKDLLIFNLSFMMKGYRKILYIFLYLIFLPATVINFIAEHDDINPIFGVIVLGLLAFPILLIWTIKRNFKTHKNLHEAIHYTIDDDKIHLQGQTFESSISTQSLYKVTETKKAFYLWQSNRSANIIPKHLITQEDIVLIRRWKERVKN